MGSVSYRFIWGAKYYVLFVDDFSRKVWVFVLKRKADVFNMFKQFKVMVEKRTSRTIMCLRADNGGEFTSLEFENIVKMKRLSDTKQMYTLLSKMVLQNA